MKDYIQSKLKKSKKIAFGSGPTRDEIRAAKDAAIAKQANADRLGETFTRLTPPYSNDNLASFAAVESIDLISEGPIEGFVDPDGRPCNPLRGSYLDGTVVLESPLSQRFSAHFYSGGNFNPFLGCFLDTTGKQIEILDEYSGYIDSLYNDKETITDPQLLLPDINANPSRAHKTAFKIDYTEALNDRNNLAGRSYYVYFNSPIPDSIDDQGTYTQDDDIFTFVEKNTGSFVVGKYSGAGYTRSPVVIQSIFGQDQVLDLPSNSGMPSTLYNTYSFERPVRFIASVAYESEIDALGRVTECFCKRAFFQNVISLRSGDVNDTNWNNLTAYADRAVRLPGTTWNSGVDGARCYERFEYSLDPTRKEAEGFKEPVFERITRMKDFVTGVYQAKKNYGYFLFDASKIAIVDGFFKPEQLSNERRNYSSHVPLWVEVFNYYAGLGGNSEFNFSLNPLSDIERGIAGSIQNSQTLKKRPLGIDLFLPFAQGGEKESVGVLTNFESFRNLNSVSLKESIVNEVKFWPFGSRGRQGEFPEIASDETSVRKVQNSPARSSKMAGIYKWPVYLGPNYEACDDNNNPDLNRIIVTSGDSSQTRRNKIQSGIDLSYDVFELVEDEVITKPDDVLFEENGFTTGLTCRIFADYEIGALQGGSDPYELDNATRTGGLKTIGKGLEDFWPGIGHAPGSLRSGYNKGMINNFNFANDNEYYKVPFKTTPKFFIEALGFFRAPVSGDYVISTHNPTHGADYGRILAVPFNQGTHTQDILYMWTGQKATTGDRNTLAPINPKQYGVLDGRPDIRDDGEDEVIFRDQQFVELSGLRSGEMVPICIQFYHAGREIASNDYWAGLSWGRRVKVRAFENDPNGELDLTQYGYIFDELKNQFHWNDHFNGVFYSYTGFTGLSDSEYFDERTGTLWSDATGLLDSFKKDAIIPRDNDEFPHLPVNEIFLRQTFLHASSADYPRRDNQEHGNSGAMLSGSNLTVLPTFEENVLDAGVRRKAQVFRYLNVGNNTSNLATSEILQRTLGVTVEQRNELPNSRQMYNIGDRGVNATTDWYLGYNNDGTFDGSSDFNNRPIFGAQFFTDADEFRTPQLYGAPDNIKGASKLGGIANFSNVSVEFRNGQEQQDPLKTKSITDFFIQKSLLGRYNPNVTYGPTYASTNFINVEGYFDPNLILVTGISGVQFDGQWDGTVSDFKNDISNNTVQLRWVRDNIFYPDDSLITNDTSFTIEVAGFIYVENSANYEFRLNSDDRSKVWIGESAESDKFNDNNYLVTAFHPDQVIGYTGLTGGAYYQIRYIGQNGSGPYEFKLDFRVSGSSDSYESVTGFYHDAGAAHPLTTSSLIKAIGGIREPNIDEKGRIKFGASEGTASEDARFGRNYSNWLAETPLDTDDNVVKHVIYRKEVDSVFGSFLIDALFSTEIFEEDPYNVQVNKNKAQLNIEVELGFEGLDQSIFTPTKTTQTYEGSILNQYAVDQEFTLPKYSEIIGSFEGETTISLNEKYPRYIKFKKLDFETDSTLIARSVSVFKVSEIVNCDFSYPSSAVVKFQTDARTFNTIPTRTYNLRLKKVLVPSNYFPLNSLGKDKRYIDTLSDKKYNYVNGQEAYRHVYIGDWDGSFKLAWTDNPAWVLYDLLTNDRYGIASRLDDLEDIDIFNLYKIGRYCDAVDSEGRFIGVPNGKGGLEPRFACNILLDAKENAFQTINSIASVFNGMAYWSNGTINFFADQPKDVSALFNNQNVFDGLFQYEDTLKNSRFNTVEVQFVDKDNDYRIKTEIVEDEEGIRKNGIIRKTFNARGTTSRSQARRLGRYLLYTNKNETEIVKFKTDPQALLLNIGDIFEVEDEIKNFEITASRVIGSNNSQETITVEKTFNTGSILTGIENPISVYLPTGQTTKKDLYNTISTGGKITETELDKYNKTSIKEFVITGVTEETDGIKLNLETSLFKNAYTSLRISGINTDGGPPNRKKHDLFEENLIDGQDAWNFYEIKFMAKGDVPYPRNPIDPNTDGESPFETAAASLQQVITGATESIFAFEVANNGQQLSTFEGFALAGSGTGFALFEEGAEGGLLGAFSGNPELQAHSAYKSKYNGGISQRHSIFSSSQINDSEVFDRQNGFNQFDFYDDSNSNITKTEITGIYFFPGFFAPWEEDVVNVDDGRGTFHFLTGGSMPSGVDRAKTTQFILSDTTGFESENTKVGAEFVIDEDSYTGRTKLIMDWITATFGSTGYQDRTGEDGNLTGLIPLPIGKRVILRKDTSIDYEDLNYGIFEDYNNTNLDKIESGSHVSFRLKNTQPQLYKTMAIDHEENNLYSVMGVFHDTGKFEAIETQDFDFKYQFTGYNIGIPESAANKITEPSGFTTTAEYLESENIINFKISGDPQGNEDAYLISVVYPNGRRNQKRVLKGTEIENNFIVTSGFITELDSYGNYKLTVQSERR